MKMKMKMKMNMNMDNEIVTHQILYSLNLKAGNPSLSR